MSHRPSSVDAVMLPGRTASTICDGLLRMAYCFITELPVPELRDVRYTLDSLMIRTDRMLDLMENDLTLNFENIKIDQDRSATPGAEDFGAIFVTKTVTIDASPSESVSARYQTIPENELESAPVSAPPKTHGRYPLILSSRDDVGFPDYTHHPYFVRPGVPGVYSRPPNSSEHNDSESYYVVTKGLYVGIFTDQEDVLRWVMGVPGSFFRQVKSWADARDLYNSRLARGAVRVLL